MLKPRWSRLNKLGNGEFGLVYRVRNLETQAEYAVKVARGCQEYDMVLRREIKMHSKLDHPNIIRFVTSFECTKQPHLVIELADGGEVFEKVQKPEGLPFGQVQAWSRDIVNALIYLKGEKIIHRDVKMENILVHNGVAKLADFGVACRADDIPKENTLQGTPYYSAPEILTDVKYSYQSDVWALGVCIYAMLTRKYPFDAPDIFMLRNKIIDGDFVKLPKEYSSVEVLLEADPDVRVKIEDVLQLEFFRSSKRMRS